MPRRRSAWSRAASASRRGGTGAAGVPANPLTLLPTNPVVFGVTSNGNLWEHNTNLAAGQAGALPEQTLEGNWYRISAGNFQDIAAVADFTVGSGANAVLGQGPVVVYGIISGSGNLWEHNTDVTPGGVEQATDGNWSMISSGDFTRIAATLTVKPVSGSTPLAVRPVVFGALQGGSNLYEHNSVFDAPANEFVTDGDWALLSTGDIGQFAATLAATTTGGANPTTTGGDPTVFGVPSDFNLWEHRLGILAGAAEQTTNGNWALLSTGVRFATAPIAAAPSTPSTALITLNLPPVNVNLLGLQITTSNIQAQILAQTGDGQILGNLLYNVANLLNPGGAVNLLTILDQLGL